MERSATHRDGILRRKVSRTATETKRMEEQRNTGIEWKAIKKRIIVDLFFFFPLFF